MNKPKLEAELKDNPGFKAYLKSIGVIDRKVTEVKSSSAKPKQIKKSEGDK